jgi:hypothetical protein
MFEEIAKYGTPTFKRIYADWTKPTVSGWKKVLLENASTPIQQYSYSSGKNASDSALIIDAMDILYTGKVDGFCIVSSDSDFTRLATRLGEAGMKVIGIGEKKTLTPFITACDKFIYIEILKPKLQPSEDSSVSQTTTSTKSPEMQPLNKVDPGNNHWHTNFPLSQAGKIEFRYRILPHNSAYNAGNSNRFGLEQAQPLIAAPVNKNIQRKPVLTLEGSTQVLLSILKTDNTGSNVQVRIRSVSEKDEAVKLNWISRKPESITIIDSDKGANKEVQKEIVIPAMGFITVEAKFAK